MSKKKKQFKVICSLAYVQIQIGVVLIPPPHTKPLSTPLRSDIISFRPIVIVLSSFECVNRFKFYATKITCFILFKFIFESQDNHLDMKTAFRALVTQVIDRSIFVIVLLNNFYYHQLLRTLRFYAEYKYSVFWSSLVKLCLTVFIILIVEKNFEP